MKKITLALPTVLASLRMNLLNHRVESRRADNGFERENPTRRISYYFSSVSRRIKTRKREMRVKNLGLLTMEFFRTLRFKSRSYIEKIGKCEKKL